MSNKLLEKVEYLLSHSDNVYKKTLQVAFLAKRKKNLEDLSCESSKENIILISQIMKFYKINKLGFFDIGHL